MGLKDTAKNTNSPNVKSNGISSVTGVVIDVTIDPARSNSLDFTIQDPTNKFYKFQVLNSIIEANYADFGLTQIELSTIKYNSVIPDSYTQKISAGDVTVTVALNNGIDYSINNTGATVPIVSDISGTDTKAEAVNNKYESALHALGDVWPARRKPPGFFPCRVPTDSLIPSPDIVRIGHVILPGPITYASHQKSTYIDKVPSLRSSSTIKRGTGQAYETFSISITFGPDDHEELQDLLNYVRFCPFTTTYGGPFRYSYRKMPNGSIVPPVPGSYEINTNSIAIKSASLSTIEGFPGSIVLNLSFDPFAWEYYLPFGSTEAFEAYSMDDYICWPLLKLWLKSTILPSQLPTRNFTGLLRIGFPSNSTLADIENLLVTTSTLNAIPDADTFQTLYNISKNYDSGSLTSRNAKEIIVPNQDKLTSARTYVVKVNDQSSWNSLVPQENTQVGKNTTQEYYYGLVQWSTFDSYTFVDTQGNITPQSAAINLQNISKSVQYINYTSTGGIGIADIKATVTPDGSNNPSFATQVFNLVLKDFGLSYSSANPTDPDYQTYLTKAKPLIDNMLSTPWKYFGVVLIVQPKDRSHFNNQINNLSKSSQKRTANVNYNSFRQQLNNILAGAVTKNGADYIFTTQQTNDVVIERIGGVLANNMSVLSRRSASLPIHQFLGSVDTVVVVEGKCFSAEAKSYLENIKKQFDDRAINMNIGNFTTTDSATVEKGINSAFCIIDNEIFRMLGIEFALPASIEFTVIEGQPDCWNFSMNFIRFDPSEKVLEELRSIPNIAQEIQQPLQYGGDYAQFNPIVLKAASWMSLNARLINEELYPDLQLPTNGQIINWVKILIKIAKLAKGSGDNFANVVSNLNTDEQYVYNTCFEYFINPESVDNILKWNLKNSELSTKTFSSYADPDFYCYYDPDSDWGAIFDDTLGSSVGFGPQKDSDGKARNPNGISMSAPGVPTNVKDSNVLQSFSATYRMHDPAFGLTHLFPNSYLASHPHQNDPQKTLDDTLANTTYPKDRADEATKLVKDTNKKMRATSGYWWDGVNSDNPYDSTNSAGNTAVLSNSTDQSIGEGTPGSNQGLADVGSQIGKIPILVGAESHGIQAVESGSNYYGSLDDYFKVDWRQLEAVEASRFSLNTAPTIDKIQGYMTSYEDQNHNNFFFSDPGQIARDIVDNGYIPNPLDGSQIKTITDLKAFIKNYITQYLFSQEVGWDSDQADVIQGNDSDPYLVRTAVINEFYRNLPTSNSVVVDRTSTNTTQGLTYYIIPILEICRARQVDPGLILSIFLSRTNAGQASPQNNGVSIFNVTNQFIETFCTYYKQTPQGLINNPGQVIDLVIRRIKYWMGKFNNYPTLALLAFNIEAVDDTNKYLDFTEGNVQALQDPDTDVKNFYKIKQKTLDLMNSVAQSPRFTKTGRDALATLINNAFPDPVGSVISLYYSNYIEVERFMGSLDALDRSSYDDYFYPFNKLITSFDTDANAPNYYIQTNYSPGNLPVKFSSDRDLPKGTSGFYPDYNLNGGSPENEVKADVRLRAAMDPQNEGALYGHLSDIRNNAKFGRLVQAFPSFHILIVNEGFYWQNGKYKLWDEYFTRMGVSSIEVFKTKYSPGSTCSITFSNMFYNLTSYSYMEQLEHEFEVANNNRYKYLLDPIAPIRNIGSLWRDLILKIPDSETLSIWAHCNLRRIALNAGARLIVRMGYGSSVAGLPIVFSGTVAEVPTQAGMVTVVAVGDGVELDKPSASHLSSSANSFAYSDSGALGIGKDPSNIITEALISTSLTDDIFEGLFRNYSQGIAHFGDVYFANQQHYPAEVQINIYSSNLTKIEQGISEINNYFNPNALYNYDTQNNFAVEVQQPTAWKVMEVCRRACLDFVASAESFADRSTVFFGKWWWPYYYDYDPIILTQLNNTPFIGAGYTVDNSRKNKPVITYKADAVGNKPLLLPAVFDTNASSNPAVGNGGGQTFYTSNTVPEFYKKYGIVNSQYIVVTFPTDSNKRYIVGFMYDPDSKTVFLVDNDKTIEKITSNTPSNGQSLTDYMQGRIEGTLNQKSTTGVTGGQSPFTIKDVPTNTITSNVFDGVNLPSDFLEDVTNLVNNLKWKPYMQCYIAHPYFNLLENNIRASSDKMATDAIGSHSYNGIVTKEGMQRTITFSVDTNIFAGDRKTMMVDTGIQLTAMTAGTDAIAGIVTGFAKHIPGISLFAGPADKWIDEIPCTPAIENAVVSALTDAVKEMYQGWFIITGMSSVKPRDLFIFTDFVVKLDGPLFVKEVVHKMDVNTGFITYVSPDAVVTPHVSVLGQQILTSLNFNAFKRMVAIWTTRSTFAAFYKIITGFKEKRAFDKTGAGADQDYKRVARAVFNDDSAGGGNFSGNARTFEQAVDNLIGHNSGSFNDVVIKAASKVQEGIDLRRAQEALDYQKALLDLTGVPHGGNPMPGNPFTPSNPKTYTKEQLDTLNKQYAERQKATDELEAEWKKISSSVTYSNGTIIDIPNKAEVWDFIKGSGLEYDLKATTKDLQPISSIFDEFDDKTKKLIQTVKDLLEYQKAQEAHLARQLRGGGAKFSKEYMLQDAQANAEFYTQHQAALEEVYAELEKNKVQAQLIFNNIRQHLTQDIAEYAAQKPFVESIRAAYDAQTTDLFPYTNIPGMPAPVRQPGEGSSNIAAKELNVTKAEAQKYLDEQEAVLKNIKDNFQLRNVQLTQLYSGGNVTLTEDEIAAIKTEISDFGFTSLLGTNISYDVSRIFSRALRAMVESPLGILKVSYQTVLALGKGLGYGGKNIYQGFKVLTDPSYYAKVSATLPTDTQFTPISRVFSTLKDFKAATVGKDAAAGDRVRGTFKAVGSAIKDEWETFRTLQELATWSDPLVGVIKDTLWYAIGNSLVEGINSELRARQCVKVIPLMANNVPYTAGLRGHQGAVVGDQPGWTDQFFMGLFGVGNWNPAYNQTVGFIGSVLGIEPPDYGPTAIDQYWLDYYKKLDQQPVGSAPTDQGATPPNAK